MNDVSLNPEIVELEAEMEYEMPQYPVIPNPEGEATGYVTKLGFTPEILQVKDPEVHDWARAEEKPTYTKEEVGLGNVDDTSDMDKPVSTATQTALNGKVDNSTLNNYYTKTQTDSALSLKADSSSVYTKTEADNLLNGKVDKVEGYGLSENDFTDTNKTKLDGIEAEANKTVVDNALDGTSANPVENRVVKSSLDEKLNADETAVNSNGLVIATPVTDTAPYIYRQTPVKESFKALMKKIVGASVVWNQLVDSNTTSVTIASGHRYIAKINGTLTFGTSDGSAITVSANDYFTDLTALFGTIIADYVYTLETSQSGSGIAWLQSYGFFTEDYYAYKQNKLESGCVSAHKTYDGETLLTNTELSPLTLRGIFNLSTDKLTVDGDEYNADGSVTRKYGIVDLGDLRWTYDTTYQRFYASVSGLKVASARTLQLVCANYISVFNSESMSNVPDKSIYQGSTNINVHDSAYAGQTAEQFKTAMNGVYVIYPLATPTTEQTTPYTETEIVGSTEEFIDYEVAQGNRDVAIPVGTDTDYYQEMKLPSLPTTSGNHNLIYNIATGFGWS